MARRHAAQRVQRPMAVELFAGSGIVSYGAVVSWNILRQLEFAVRVGKRADELRRSVRAASADCTRTTVGGGVRWMLLPKDFSPFVGAGFSVDLGAPAGLRFDPTTGQSKFLKGKGRAHSLNLSAGLQLCRRLRCG